MQPALCIHILFMAKLDWNSSSELFWLIPYLSQSHIVLNMYADSITICHVLHLAVTVGFASKYILFLIIYEYGKALHEIEKLFVSICWFTYMKKMKRKKSIGISLSLFIYSVVFLYLVSVTCWQETNINFHVIYVIYKDSNQQ